MNVASSSSPFAGAFRGLAAGLRAQTDAQLTRNVIEMAGLGGGELSASLKGVEAQGAAVAAASIEIAGARMTGQLLDVLA